MYRPATPLKLLWTSLVCLHHGNWLMLIGSCALSKHEHYIHWGVLAMRVCTLFKRIRLLMLADLCGVCVVFMHLEAHPGCMNQVLVITSCTSASFCLVFFSIPPPVISPHSGLVNGLLVFLLFLPHLLRSVSLPWCSPSTTVQKFLLTVSCCSYSPCSLPRSLMSDLIAFALTLGTWAQCNKLPEDALRLGLCRSPSIAAFFFIRFLTSSSQYINLLAGLIL